MMDIRSSTAESPNAAIKALARRTGEGNVDWLARAAGSADPAGTLVLFGGASLTDFRVRVAQSSARRDLLPSFWSHVALVDRQTARDWTLHEISLEPGGGFGSVPLQNGIQRGSLRAYDDPVRYPNIAHIRFTTAGEALESGETLASVLRGAVSDLQKQRSTLDLPALLLEWLGYAWGVADRPNPLDRQQGMPSAVFVESVFAMAGIELSPGAATRSSCPEAIWQSAKWWHEFYASDVTMTQAAPTGAYAVEQPAAAALIEPPGLSPSPRRRRSEAPGRRASAGRRSVRGSRHRSGRA
jgi:hypothetical protein